MSRIVAQFDPSAKSGSFSAAAVNRCSALLFMNESANFLTLDFGGAFPSTILQPWSNRLIRLAQPVQTVYWTVAATLASTDAPVSQVYVEAFDPSETLDGIVSGPLFRQTNVGNAVSTSASTPNSLEQDMLTPVILSGFVATKDGGHPNQLDVGAGVALLRQSDQSLGRVAPAATTFDTTTANATYFLDLQPDGSFSFATTHSGQPNYLSIAQVTTDASANISAISDARLLNTVILNGFVGLPKFPGGLSLGGGLLVGGGSSDATMAALDYNAVANLFDIWTRQGGSEQDIAFILWNGSAAIIPFGLGSNNPASALTNVGNGGQFTRLAGQSTVGSFGVPSTVAETLGVNVTTTAQTTILSYTPSATGWYRISATIKAQNTSNNPVISLFAQYFSPDGGLNQTVTFLTGVTGAAVALNSFALTLPASNVRDIGCDSVIIHAPSGSAINVIYQDATATPNDIVAVFIERLA